MTLKIKLSIKWTIVLLFLNLSFSCFAFCETKLSKTKYEIKQDSVWIETTNGKIFGLLFRPIGIKKDKNPAILCLQGGGDVGLANYLYEAKFFAKNGIAALVCDKSGTGLSNTKKSWRQQSFKDKTNEYMELFTWLSNYSGIDNDKVGVHGMSEGGSLALNMAIEHPDKIAFVNAVSGPTISYKENQLYAIYNHLRLQNIDNAIIVKAVKVWNLYFDDIGKGEISKKTLSSINELAENAPDLRYRPSNSTELPSRPLSQDIHFTLKGRITKIICPVLLQYGELDVLVDAVKSLSLIPKKSNFEIKNYADTDHSMNLRNGDIHPRFLADKLIWIKNLENRE
jgi:pimeloyl-ACP methyl ester carboxylesterase